ncbi:1_t:CDS:1 [Funneliformis mosseae]|uniref:1_t:CDS:1 n=1 Tax=Funneliformis mosseae TaxID=27381 RepID=A0A9N9BBP5_FUNMO|nr:1_t:CDS:1 [Funneliformis mosseae]
MPFQLPYECLNEILKNLKVEKDLRSCSLVNHFWCEVSIRILWRNIHNYNLLIGCFSDESKEILRKNDIIISTSTSKPLFFDYIKFIKNLSVHDTVCGVLKFLKDQQPDDDNKKFVVTQEIFKMLMGQVTLKKLEFCSRRFLIPNIPITTYPGAKDCLKNLSEFDCSSNIDSEIFYQMSRICHNIESLSITLEDIISNGLAELISVQKNLKCLNILHESSDVMYVPPLIANINDTVIKLRLEGRYLIPLSFISKLINLQELLLSFRFEGFEDMEYMTLPNLQILKFYYNVLIPKPLIIFFENSGKNLRVLDLHNTNDNSLNLAVAKFCSNLRSLRTVILDVESTTLKVILQGCQKLESIYLLCGSNYLNESILLEIIVNDSPRNFHELKMDYVGGFDHIFFQTALAPVFRRWENRTPKNTLSLFIIGICGKSIRRASSIVIKKFQKSGIIKFGTINSF